MRGVVMAGEASVRGVLGLTIGMRAILALQSAGASDVNVCGANAALLEAAARSDPRVRVPVTVAIGWSAGDSVIVADGAVIDARAVRTAINAGARVRVCDGDFTAIARTDAGAHDVPNDGTIVAASVAVIARDASGARRATRALLESLRKPQDGWVATRLNRHISLAMTRALVWTPLRPNPLSVLILAAGVYGAWLAARGDRVALAIGGVLFQTQSVLDGCDGELSRLTFRGSKLGEWLDTVGDDVTNYAFFGGAAIGLARMGLGSLPLILGAIGVALAVITSGIEYAYLIKIGSGDLLKYPLGFGNDPEPAANASPFARVLGAMRPAFKRDFFVFLSMLAALAGPAPMLCMLGLFVAGAAATFAAVVRSEWSRRRARRGSAHA